MQWARTTPLLFTHPPPIRRKLDVAVGEEDYEMAARLRDERKVEGWIEGGPG